MRIPSQFNDDNLYRHRTERVDQAGAMRHLVRLLIGLALVLVVMKQAARPELYQTFFGSPSGPVAAVTTVEAELSRPAGSPGGSPAPQDTTPPAPADLAIGRSLSLELRPSDRREWMAVLARVSTGRPAGIVPSTIEALIGQLGESQQLDPQRTEVWLELLERLRQADPSQSVRLPAANGAAARAWLFELDQEAVSRVVDGSTWRGGDFDALYRYLDESVVMSPQGADVAGVLPLLQQPEVYRHQTIVVKGRVARAERIPAEANPFLIDAYWQLWVRPNDGTDRPCAIIVPEVPVSIAQVGPNASNENGPPISMVGRFLKRLAYRSEQGADLAPVVVGRLLTAPREPSATVAAVPVSASDRSQRVLWITMLASSVLGVGIAALVMWRTAVSTRHARQLRAAGGKPAAEFLTQLGEPRSEDDQ